MKHKLKIDVKTMFKGMFLSFLFVFSQSVPVHADTGDLKINNHVIYDKKEDHQNKSTTFTINQLFMKDMTEQDKQIGEKKSELLTNAKKQVFMKETPVQHTGNKQITPLLFSSKYVLNDNLDSGNIGLRQGRNIGFILFCVVGGFLVVGLGILLGRAFPTWGKKGIGR